MMDEATELEFLRWFYANADFGPAHGDVMYLYREQFENNSGLRVPEECRDDD